MKMTVSDAFMHRGKAGVSVIVDVDGLHPGRYAFSSHGLSPAQLTARVDALQSYHAAKSRRLDGFRHVHGTTLRPGYRISDCTIRERGTDVELVLRVKSDAGETLRLDRTVRGIDDVPNDAEIVRMARDAAVAHANRRKVADDHVNTVKQVLGIKGDER